MEAKVLGQMQALVRTRDEGNILRGIKDIRGEAAERMSRVAVSQMNRCPKPHGAKGWGDGG